MAQKYVWNGNEYSSMSEVTSAANTKKNHMNTCPSDYVDVKVLGGSAEAGWTIPQETLTHSEILNVSADDGNFYSVASIEDGDTSVGLTASEMIEEVKRLTRQHGSRMQLDKVIIYEEVDTDTDMTGYV